MLNSVITDGVVSFDGIESNSRGEFVALMLREMDENLKKYKFIFVYSDPNLCII